MRNPSIDPSEASRDGVSPGIGPCLIRKRSRTSWTATLEKGIPPFVRLILIRLKKAGHAGFIVGGAPRDFLLGRMPTDWDVATPAPVPEIRRLFRDKRQFALRDRTVTLLDDDGTRYEVTPYRGDRPLLRNDLARRDFTLNAMAFDPETGRIIDPFHGQADIGAGRIRGVGDPADRFREDPIRLLRAIRLHAELGFIIDRRTQEALVEQGPLIARAAPERIRDELIRLLLAPRPSVGVNRLAGTGVLGHLIPELLEGRLKRQNAHHRFTIFKHVMETVDHIEPKETLRLAALLHDVAKPRVRTRRAGHWRFHGHEAEGARMAEDILKRFRFGGTLVQEVVLLIRHHGIVYHPAWGDASVRRLIRRVGPGRITDLIALRRADLLAHGRGAAGVVALDDLERRIQAELRGKNPTDRAGLAIDGRDVMEVMGIPSGQRIGDILARLTELVVESPDLNRREHLLALLKTASWTRLDGRTSLGKDTSKG